MAIRFATMFFIIPLTYLFPGGNQRLPEQRAYFLFASGHRVPHKTEGLTLTELT